MSREELDKQLKALNRAVDDAIKARTRWMDAHMEDYAKFKVGDPIYSRDTMRRVGVVTELYRYHQGSNPLNDTNMHIDYQFKSDKTGCIDNTSRSYSAGFLTKDEFVSELEFIRDRETGDYQKENEEMFEHVAKNIGRVMVETLTSHRLGKKGEEK